MSNKILFSYRLFVSVTVIGFVLILIGCDNKNKEIINNNSLPSHTASISGTVLIPVETPIQLTSNRFSQIYINEVPLQGMTVTVCKMTEDGSLVNINNISTQTDSNGCYTLTGIPRENNLIIVATKETKDIYDNTIVITLKGLVCIDDYDLGKIKTDVNLSVESTLFAGSVKYIVNQIQIPAKDIDIQEIDQLKMSISNAVFHEIGQLEAVDIIARIRWISEDAHEDKIQEKIQNLRDAVPELDETINDLLAKGTIKGLIVDSTENPLANAAITVMGGGLTTPLEKISDASGFYSIRVNVSPYPYNVKATLLGYQDKEETEIYITESETIIIDFIMIKNRIQPPPTIEPQTTATINLPQNNDSFNRSEEIRFVGAASNAEEGNLTGESLVWSSSIDGQIGTGTSFTKNDLSIGAHIITLTTTASSGYTASNSLTITIVKSRWENQYGGDEDDWPSFIQPAAEGGYIITGYSGLDWGGDAYVAKIKNSGQKEWELTYSDSENDNTFCSVQQTLDGGYVIAGRRTAEGDVDICVVKIDSDGNKIWEKTYGESGEEYAFFIRKTSDGGYIIAGEIYAAKNADIYILKVDKDGNKIWGKNYGTSRIEKILRYSPVQQTIDGGYILAGISRRFVSEYDDYYSDVYVVKIDSDGNIIWQKFYGGNDDDEASSVQETADGGYIIAGHTCSFNAYEKDVYIIKIDSNGNIIWQKTYGGDSDDEASSVQETADGGYIITGHTCSFDADEKDVYIIKIDSNGDIIWERIYGGDSDDEASFIQQTADGGYIVIGNTCSFSESKDIYVLKTDEEGYVNQFPPSIEISSPSNNEFFIPEANIVFIGSASDPEDGNLVGNSIVWTSSLDGSIGTGTSFTRNDLSVGVHTITLSAIDSDGKEGEASIKIINCYNDNNPPTFVSIILPLNNSSFNSSATVTFEGEAFDLEDGDLSGESLIWKSSRDGQIGIGNSIEKTSLSSGEHTITLTAIDTCGEEIESDPRIIEITGNSDYPICQKTWSYIKGWTNSVYCSDYGVGLFFNSSSEVNDSDDDHIEGEIKDLIHGSERSFYLESKDTITVHFGMYRAEIQWEATNRIPKSDPDIYNASGSWELYYD